MVLNSDAVDNFDSNDFVDDHDVNDDQDLDNSSEEEEEDYEDDEEESDPEDSEEPEEEDSEEEQEEDDDYDKEQEIEKNIKIAHKQERQKRQEAQREVEQLKAQLQQFQNPQANQESDLFQKVISTRIELSNKALLLESEISDMEADHEAGYYVDPIAYQKKSNELNQLKANVTKLDEGINQYQLEQYQLQQQLHAQDIEEIKKRHPKAAKNDVAANIIKGLALNKRNDPRFKNATPDALVDHAVIEFKEICKSVLFGDKHTKETRKNVSSQSRSNKNINQKQVTSGMKNSEVQKIVNDIKSDPRTMAMVKSRMEDKGIKDIYTYVRQAYK